MNPGSERLQVNLVKESADQSWGFRLQGGADFTTPLSVQSVTPGGLAESCGLKAGDAVLSLNGRPSDELEHDAAKQIIVMAGNEVSLLVQRGAVKVWQPKVTPLSMLRPGELRQAGDLNGPDPYVQRTSLAADKQEYKPIGTGYNRSARPFPGFGGSNFSAPAPAAAPAPVAPPAPAPAPVIAPASQWSSPSSQQYAAPPAASANPGSYGAPPISSVQDVKSGMANLHVNDDDKTTPMVLVTNDKQEEPVSPSLRMIRDLEQGRAVSPKRPLSPKYAALVRAVEEPTSDTDSQGYLQVTGQPPRSVSPTLLAVQESERKQCTNHREPSPAREVRQSAGSAEPRESDEFRFHGYTDQNKQSRSFRLLQAEVEDGGSGGSSSSMPAGMRSVRAPVSKPASEPRQDAQYMTCKVCGSLCVGVFIRVKGEPMHPECYKCVACGVSLKNQGFYTLQEQLYCGACAQKVAQQQTGGQVTTVYR